MPKTTAMNISLPESMRDWVISQTENGQYSNNSDVVRDLIRKEQHRQEKIRRLQEAVDKGLASGVAKDFDMEAVIEKMEKATYSHSALRKSYYSLYHVKRNRSYRPRVTSKHGY